MIGAMQMLMVAATLGALCAVACTPAVRPTLMPRDAPLTELWQPPDDLPSRNLYYGPWGPEHAPDPHATYTFVAQKRNGVRNGYNPGVIILDPKGRRWHVKQASQDKDCVEGPVEVVVSRVLSAIGYHQPPVYFLPTFTMRDRSGTHSTPGGRFRLDLTSLEHRGDWSWQQNPFVGMRPYHGLLAILVMFNSSDLKNVNNVLYAVKKPDGGIDHWFVVRDLGASLGETAHLFPRCGDPDLFEREPFITGVKDRFVEFNYHAWHQELLRNRITPGDVRWASQLLAGLSDRQWADAFRAGGYEPAVAARFIARLHQKINEGLEVGDE